MMEEGRLAVAGLMGTATFFGGGGDVGVASFL